MIKLGIDTEPEKNVLIFFYCLNGKRHIKQRKDDVAPYTSINDPGFENMEKGLTGLNEKTLCAAMQLSHQTLVGIETTVRVRCFTSAGKCLMTPVEEGLAGKKIFYDRSLQSGCTGAIFLQAEGSVWR